MPIDIYRCSRPPRHHVMNESAQPTQSHSRAPRRRRWAASPTDPMLLYHDPCHTHTRWALSRPLHSATPLGTLLLMIPACHSRGRPIGTRMAQATAAHPSSPVCSQGRPQPDTVPSTDADPPRPLHAMMYPRHPAPYPRQCIHGNVLTASRTTRPRASECVDERGAQLRVARREQRRQHVIRRAVGAARRVCRVVR